MSEASGQSEGVFRERPTEPIATDAFRLGVFPAAAAGLCGLLGWTALGWVCLGATLFVGFFFRNPRRRLPPGENAVVSPADGRVIAVDEIEVEGGKALRIGIFLSVFNVHVNRAPLAGRVVAVERGGRGFRAAFDPRAEQDNVRCTLQLETARGVRFQVTQITGLVARRIVCHPQVGEWLERGARYGLIRFGSRTDVVLPLGTTPRVAVGDRVRGGSSIVAELAGAV